MIVSARRHIDDDLFIFQHSAFSLTRLKLGSSFSEMFMKQSTRFPSLWGQSTSEAFCTAVVDFVQRHGAVSGIVKRMDQLGLGTIARSWLGNDVNIPIFSEQL